MHFGIYRLGMNPFNREAMLQEMNHEVIRHLCLGGNSAHVIDLGCGTGATARTLARQYKSEDACVAPYPALCITGVTISPVQAAQGTLINANAKLENITLLERDYTNTQLPTASFDGAYAVESACHATGPDKVSVIKEAARLLKPGAKFVIADAMRRDGKPLSGLLGLAHRVWCKSWPVPELGQTDAIVAALAREGFTDIQVNDISLRVGVSAAHIPSVATRYLCRTVCDEVKRLITTRGTTVPHWRWRHLAASYLSLVLGIALHRMGYFIITATRA
jgi:SAM-dependent methyltransferase